MVGSSLIQRCRRIPAGTEFAGTGKNPFAKKAAAASNPFARQAVAKPLDSMKSTSFFERVDNIELSGVPKGTSALLNRVHQLIGTSASSKPKPKAKPKDAGGKQATLVGMKKGMPPPRAAERESFGSTVTEGDCEETMRSEVPAGILEESQVSWSRTAVRVIADWRDRSRRR